MSTSADAAITESSDDIVGAEVSRYLARYVDDVTLLERERLISSGLLDSLAAVALIAFLQKRFAIEVLDEDLDLANFDSVAQVVAFVARKRAG
ncbi:acyl carrier protein [Actinoplanes sp. LDG1-06]|uniref:Acyl carrier protein n=1 Tax=Paractinoplanes ovalisporus TaxID=2810368 RepID=A0ABS2AKK7_9ACTN|nr:acyl carrier protein [Actinoplanes ovalisporus]MBM2620370.1 acyl carrier protein [Actinoplanes ovalisporus]